MISATFQCRIRAAAACLLAVLLCPACGGDGGQTVDVVLDRPLVLLGEYLPAPAAPQGQDSPQGLLTINDELRQVVQAHPPQVFRFRVVPGPRTRLLFGAALDPEPGRKAAETVSVFPSRSAAGPAARRNRSGTDW